MKIGVKQQRAIVALVRGRNQLVAAKAAGVNDATVWRWQRDPDFQQAYQTAIDRVYRQAMDLLRRAATRAVRTLIRGTKARVDPGQIRAANYLLSHAAKATEILELVEKNRLLTERLGALEAHVETAMRKYWTPGDWAQELAAIYCHEKPQIESNAGGADGSAGETVPLPSLP